MTKIKICGLRTPDDIEIANEFLPDYIGYVFAESKRQISHEQATKLSAKVSDKIKKVGVFCNQPVKFVADILIDGTIDYIQLHGEENSEYEAELFDYLSQNGIENPQSRCIKAYRIRSKDDIISTQNTNCSTLLLDAFSAQAQGGTGEKFDWSLIENMGKPFFLAGGISADNAQTAIATAHPFALDASSSVETDGKKDREKVRQLITAVRS